MTEQRDDTATLETVLGDLRGQTTPLPDDLFARIMADATAVDAHRAVAPLKPGWFAGFGAMLGGWPSMAGLATAAVAGLWIGVVQPVALDGFGLGPGVAQTGYELGDLMPGFDILASGE